jgi:hypothetical protein
LRPAKSSTDISQSTTLKTELQNVQLIDHVVIRCYLLAFDRKAGPVSFQNLHIP